MKSVLKTKDDAKRYVKVHAGCDSHGDYTFYCSDGRCDNETSFGYRELDKNISICPACFNRALSRGEAKCIKPRLTEKEKEAIGLLIRIESSYICRPNNEIELFKTFESLLKKHWVRRDDDMGEIWITADGKDVRVCEENGLVPYASNFIPYELYYEMKSKMRNP